MTFDCIYLKDTLTPGEPRSELQPVDWAVHRAGRARPTAFLNFLLGSRYPIDQDLPGNDRPETMDALYAEADAWLSGALDIAADGVSAMQGAIDVHAHVVPAGFPAAPASCCEQWPGMAHGEGGRASVMMGAREFRKIDSRSWDAPRRLG